MYSRPLDWLKLPIIKEGQNKIVGLFAVYDETKADDKEDTHRNLFGIQIWTVKGNSVNLDLGFNNGPQEVDGQGSIQSFELFYADYPSSSLSTRGYRQAILTLTCDDPTDSFQSINFDRVHEDQVPKWNDGTNPSSGWLDIAVAGPNIRGIYFNGEDEYSGQECLHYNLEQFAFVGRNSIDSFSFMFKYCKNLKNVKPMYTSRGATFKSMFSGCQSLRSIPLLDTSNGTIFDSMFYDCSSLELCPALNTHKGISFTQMFLFCTSLRSVPHLDFTHAFWFSEMFYYCSSLTSIYNINLPLVRNANNMFAYCINLRTVEHFSAPNCNYEGAFDNMFENCTSLYSITRFNAKSYLKGRYIFGSAKHLKDINLSNFTWNDSADENGDPGHQFANAVDLETVENLDMRQVLYFHSCFFSCYALTSVKNLNFKSATTLDLMFKGCSSLSTVEKLLIDNNSTKTCSQMFNGCVILPSLKNLNTKGVVDMEEMFYGCESLTTIPLLNTSLTTNMAYMFQNCYSLREVPLLDTSSAINMSLMFSGCKSMTEVPLLDTSKAVNVENMFFQCSALRSIPAFNFEAVITNLGDIFDSCILLEECHVYGIKYDHCYEDTNLTAGALNEVFENLGEAGDGGASIDLYHNIRGVYYSNWEIATDKGWTLNW